MPRYLISGVVTRELEIEAETLYEGVQRWVEEAGGGYPDGFEELGEHPEAAEAGGFVGACESCGYPILEDEPYNWDDDGCYWHRDEDPCPPEDPR